jgi:hypothetical protein
LPTRAGLLLTNKPTTARRVDVLQRVLRREQRERKKLVARLKPA